MAIHVAADVSGDLLLAIDVGLTTVKAVLFEVSGAVAGIASRPYPTLRQVDGHVEQQPDDWWQAAQGSVHQLWHDRAHARHRVAAIGVTGHMHAVVCVNGAGRAIGPSLVLGDRRAWRQATRLENAVGAERVYALTGARMDASMPAAKIAWLLQEQPEIGRALAAVLSCKDYIRHRLTGDIATDPIDACATSLYDIQRGEWSAELIDRVGLRPDQVPPVQPSEARAGGLRAAAAQALGGLQQGLPVAVGAGDDVEVA